MGLQNVFYIIYLVVLVVFLFYVSIKKKEFLFFSHYPMFSKYFSQDKIPAIYTIYLLSSNKTLSPWHPPLVDYGKLFGNQFFTYVMQFLVLKGEKKVNIKTKVDIIIETIIISAAPLSIERIYLVKKEINPTSFSQSVKKIIQIKILTQKTNNWKISLLK